MPEKRLYDSLLGLPLFLGMTRCDLLEIAGTTKFYFQKLKKSHVIAQEGEPCLHINFLIKGEIKVITEADDHGYQIEETIKAPEVLQVERFFGFNQHYTHTYIAGDDCNIMSFSRKELMKLSDNYEIFRINQLNILTTQTQKSERRLFRVPPKTLEERIIRFFESHCLRPAGEKTFRIKMTRLAEEMNVKRIYISNVLNEMEEKGLIQLYRGIIVIPSLENLIAKNKS